MLPTAMNIIAKYRRNVMENVSKMLSHDKGPIHVVLENHKEKKSDKEYVIDKNYETLCIICLTFYFSANFRPEELFFYMRKADNFTESDWNSSQEIPIMIETFNQYIILYKEKSYQVPDFETCFLHWIFIVCTSQELKGMLRTKKSSINALFLSLIKHAEETSMVKKNYIEMTSQKPQHLSDVPDFYMI
jgi:hypothetical protein